MDHPVTLSALQERRFRMERLLHDAANPVAILQANLEFLAAVAEEERVSQELLDSIRDMQACIPLLVASLQHLRALNQEKVEGE